MIRLRHSCIIDSDRGSSFYDWIRVERNDLLGAVSTEDIAAIPDFIISPNPVNDMLTINLENTTDGNIKIHDTHGRLLLTYYLWSARQVLIPVFGFDPGLYYLTMSSGNKEKQVRKFVKM